jgi:hypothetical protein
MAGSLTDDELKSLTAYPEPALEPAPAKRDPQQLRAEAIVKDIYARHGIKPDVPLDKAMTYISANAQVAGLMSESGQSTSMWANPEGRAAAREAYARKGKSPEEVKERWDKSVYLMDPQTARLHQGFVRDADFLEHLSAVPAEQPFEYHYGPNASGPQVAPKLGDALDYWDRSNMTPLWRDSAMSGNYQSTGGTANLVGNAVSNPDVPLGNYANFSEVFPDYMRMQGSGETATGSESWEAAAGKRLALNRYRPLAPSMIGDLPPGATQADVGRRVAELREELRQAELPNPDQRWRQWSKKNFGFEFAPPKVVSTTLDSLFSSADPSALIPAAAGVRTIARAGGAGAKAVAADFAKDQAVEQGINHAIVQATGGAADGKARTDSEIDAARKARKAIHDRLANDGAIKSADDAAWSRLQKDGLVSPWVR